MSKYIIVSTFPTAGSKNIGDKLIEERTIRLIKDVKGDCEIKTMWREERFEDHIDEINDSDALIFACLAIRRNMIPKLYGFSDSLDRFTVPFVPIAAGTSFRPAEIFLDQTAARIVYDDQTVNFLKAVSGRTTEFSCRGEVTYNFLRSIGIDNAVMTGDVAFYEPRFNSLQFVRRSSIERIAVSTPHQPKIYAEQFYLLVEMLRNMFPRVEIDVVVHGASEWIDRKRIGTMNAALVNIYEEPASALDVYSTVDLHVGFRVHGHVSALKRRKPSYLLATDGRGYDYGMTLRTGTTWPAWKAVLAKATFGDSEESSITQQYPQELDLSSSFVKFSDIPSSGDLDRSELKRLALRPARLLTRADMDLVGYVLDVIRRDALSGFDRFLGFDVEIEKFNRNLISLVSRL